MRRRIWLWLELRFDEILLTMTWQEYRGAKYRPANVRRDVTFPLLGAV